MALEHNEYLFFLGSHPQLSAAECIAVLTSQDFDPVIKAADNHVALITVRRELPDSFLANLGGIERIAQVVRQQTEPLSSQHIVPYLTSVPASRGGNTAAEGRAHQEVPAEPALLEAKPPDALASLGQGGFTAHPAGKQIIGISTLGLSKATGLDFGRELKEWAVKQGRRLRFVLPRGRSSTLNAAQVIFNKLLTTPNQELIIAQLNDTHILAVTVQIQNIIAYERRDTQRPARDARVGMLPPKLAQIMINLAIGHLPRTLTSAPFTVYDPFCGMGTILQEGWLKGLRMLGSDLSDEMLAATEHNLADLAGHTNVDPTLKPTIFKHDARTPFPPTLSDSVTAVVTEAYLGEALRSAIPTTQLTKHTNHLTDLYYDFFKHIYSTLRPGGTILFVLPAFKRGSRAGNTFALLPDTFLDSVVELGYSREQLIPPSVAAWYPSERQTILYARPDALVGREFSLWRKQ